MSTTETEVSELNDEVDPAEQLLPSDNADVLGKDDNDIWLRDTPNELIPKMGELPVSSAAYYQQLVITEAAGSGGGSGPLDKRISPFASDEVTAMNQPSVGVLLTFEQGWFQEGLALGELRKSLCLAPGEVTRVAVVDWRRKTTSRDQSATSQTEALAAQTDDASAAVTVQQSMLEETRSSSSFVMGSSSHSQVGGSGGIPLFFSASGSVSKSAFMGFSATASAGERNVASEASKNIQRRTQQLSQSSRSARATQIREVSEEEGQTTTTRVVANYNHAHALTMQYYEVLQIYRLQTRTIRADRCIFIPIKPFPFDEQSMIATSDSTLELLRHVLQDFGATELDDMVAEFQRNLPTFKGLRKLAAEAVELRARIAEGSRRKIEAPRVWGIETRHVDGRRTVIRNTRSPDLAALKAEDTLSRAQRLAGTYENFPQNPSLKNDWHDVTITAVDEVTLKWTNGAGVSWTLRLADDNNVLEVGADCPYFSTGYTTAQIAYDVYGNVKHVIGPGNSPYLNEENRVRRLIGVYENFPQRANVKNDWHYVNISAAGGSALTWTNRAGASWTLRLTGDDNVLAVGANCPYFADGYTTARVGFDLLGNVTHVVGPGNSPYVNEATSKMVHPQWGEQTVTVVPSMLPGAAVEPAIPLIEQEEDWRREAVDVASYVSQGPSRGRIWDQWSWYMVDTRNPGSEPSQVTDADLVQVDMWRSRVSFGSGVPDANIIAQFQSEAEHSAWVADTLRLAQVERRYEIDRKDLDAFGRLFGLLDDVALVLNQQMWMRTDDYTWRGLLTGRVFPRGEYEGQDIGGMVNPTPQGFFGNYLAFLWDFPQDRPGETMYRDQANAFDAAFIDSEEVAAAKTKNHATIALPTEGIFAEAVLGQSNSAEKIDMTRFWNWQESPIPILPPEMATVSTESRARDVASPDRLRLADALAGLRAAGIDKELLDDSAILNILNESLDNGSSAALLANAVTSATTASDNAAAGAGSAGQASVDVSKQIQDFVVDLANSEAAKIATDAAIAYATGGASKVGGLLNKASKGASRGRLKSGSKKSSVSRKTVRKKPASKPGKGTVRRETTTPGNGKPGQGEDDDSPPGPSDSVDSGTQGASGQSTDDSVGDLSQADLGAAVTRAGQARVSYDQKWMYYLEHSSRSKSEKEQVEDLLVLIVSACSYFDSNFDKLGPTVGGELDIESQTMVDVVNRAADAYEDLMFLIESFENVDKDRLNKKASAKKKLTLKTESEHNQEEDQRLLDKLGDVIFDMRVLITNELVSD